jgi:hypothetical protein
MKSRIILSAAYLALAAGAWIDFVNTNPHALANLGLMLVVLPVTVAGLFIGWRTRRASSFCRTASAILVIMRFSMHSTWH